MKKYRFGFILLLLSFTLGVLFANENNVSDASNVKHLTDKVEKKQFQTKMSGNFTWRYDQYQYHGDPAGTPWRFDGQHNYLDLNFQLNGQYSEFDRWQFRFSGVSNDSRYRKVDNGFEVEWIQFKREFGEGNVPWRVELGNIYANFSYRTLQRSLKGLQFELQPPSREGFNQSIVFISGISTRDWKGLETARDHTTGISWLIKKIDGIRLALNLVYNTRQADTALGLLDRIQRVFSIALEVPITIINRPATFETELAYFDGDHDGTTGAASGQGKSDRAFFAQLRGGKRPFTYRLRFEDNGKDYRPVGAVIAPDRQSIEGYFTWQLNDGKDLTLRYQNFKNNKESINPSWNRLVGLDLRGIFSHRYNVRGSVSVWTQRDEDRNLSFKRATDAISANLSKPIGKSVDARLDVSWQNQNDKLGVNDLRQTRIGLALDSAVSFFNSKGRMSLGVVNRNMDGISRVDEWVPTAGFQFSRKRHDFSMNYTLPRQAYNSVTQPDMDQSMFAARYGYRGEHHSAGLEYNLQTREDTAGSSTRAWQLGFYYRRDIDSILGRNSKAIGVIETGLIYADLIPGMSLAEATSRVEKFVGHKGNRRDDLTVFEGHFIEEVNDRQRLALESNNGDLKRAVIIAEPLLGAQPTEILDIYNRFRRELLQKLGQPTQTLELGMLSPALIQDIQSGSFIRIMEWDREGSTIRLGIPRRLDGEIRIELQISNNLPSRLDTAWSLELLR